VFSFGPTSPANFHGRSINHCSKSGGAIVRGATIDTAESILYTATHCRNTTPTTTLTENLSATLDRLEQLYEGHTVAGTPTGYLDYDTLTGGLHPGELTVIGARPAMGKSILGLGIAGHVAIKEGLPALHFSLEMSTHELTTRLLGGVELTRFRTGRFTENDWALITDAIGLNHPGFSGGM
jgi:replicative DNA helicase